MFRIGERVKGESHRRKHKWKANGVNTPRASPSVLSSLIEEMNGLTTESSPRRPPRRATRLGDKGIVGLMSFGHGMTIGCWQSNPWMPRCLERHSEIAFDEGAAFTFGVNVKERKRYRSKTRRQGEGFSPDTDNKESTPTTSRESLPKGPSGQIFDKLTEEYTKKAEELKALGNEALSHGFYAEARERYSEGIQLIMGNFSGWKRLRSKLYSNRAATYLCEGDPKSALHDCLEAKRIRPKNIRAYTRAATCCTCLGDFEGALKMLEQASEMLSASDPHFKSIEEQVSVVRRLKTELETVAVRCAEGDIDEDVLCKIDDLCLHAYHFERVWRLAALVYIQSGQYEKLEGIEEASLNIDGHDTCWWRWIQMEAAWWDPSQNLTCVLTAAETLLCEMRTASLTEMDTTPETPAITVDGLHHLLEQLNNANRLREDGKSAVSRQSYASAEKLYSKAIDICESVGSPIPFLSVLYCNRGAALHGQGRYLEAMSDVCIAICLHPEYGKAYLRLAQMHLETINMTAALEIAKEGHTKILQTIEAEALAQVEQKAVNRYQKDEKMMDAYKIMGLGRSCTTVDIKKTFRKFALKLHPDKAAHLVKLKLSWMEGTPYVRSQEDAIRSRLHDRLSHLFKHLNSAHSILMNEDDRALLDEELEESNFSRHRRRDRYYESYQYYSPRC